jgi:hypothetical protein
MDADGIATGFGPFTPGEQVSAAPPAPGSYRASLPDLRLSVDWISSGSRVSRLHLVDSTFTLAS